MQLRADIQLHAAIRALADTIAPAIDTENKLAVEQLQMVIGALKFVEEHLPLQFQFDCNELARLLELASDLEGQLKGEDEDILAGVRRASHAGNEVLERARADPADVLAAVRDLRTECGAVTTICFAGQSASARETVFNGILAYSRGQTLRDRSWLQSMGFEGPRANVPPIDDLLRKDAAEADRASQ